VFDQLNEYMNDSGDLQQAMRRLMQKGIKRGENQTKGIDDLLSQVAREMRKLYDEYRLQSAMDEVQEQLESIVDQERQTLEELDQAGQDTQEKKQFLNNLPGKVSEAVEKLTSYRFENTNAEKEFQQLLMQLEQIRKLENWLRREGSLFRGQTPLQFQESMDLMERMEELRRLEGQLSSMQLRDVDKELLEKLLGGDPKQDFEGVMRMQSRSKRRLCPGARRPFRADSRGIRRVGAVGPERYLPAAAPGRHGRIRLVTRAARKCRSRIAGPMSRDALPYQHDSRPQKRAVKWRRRTGQNSSWRLCRL
jgi:uncharacterized protein with von Willebrand factor type A (vWA) domain